MGRNKLLLEVGGESLVRRAVGAACGAGVHRVVVVLGHDEARIRAELEGLRCETVVNPDHARGAGTSLHAGVRQVAAEASAVVIVLADMPFVTAAMIAGLVDRYRATRAPVVFSRYGDIQAPPTLYDRALFVELLAIDDDRGGKQVVVRHQAEAEAVAWPESALHDIDVPADYDRITRGSAT
ncbi:MAG: nucleotidyltransferase family protein [Acidobacteria bacterium]|nr:MAG: nucleotidyltransferase family protein [Acidobacteriota bacterium]